VHGGCCRPWRAYQIFILQHSDYPRNRRFPLSDCRSGRQNKTFVCKFHPIRGETLTVHKTNPLRLMGCTLNIPVYTVYIPFPCLTGWLLQIRRAHQILRNQHPGPTMPGCCICAVVASRFPPERQQPLPSGTPANLVGHHFGNSTVLLERIHQLQAGALHRPPLIGG